MNYKIEDLILLNLVENLGFKKLERLLDAFQDTSRILKAKKSELLAIGGIDKDLAKKIAGLEKEEISKELRIMEKLGARAISIFSDDYPENLKTIYSPPILLYVKGEIRKEDADAVAIVGTRQPSHYGLSICDKLAGQLASNGITIISGLARGIDTMAHRGALKTGRTTAVLGSGLNYIYPPENKKLADEICERGALISEFPMDKPPYRFNFPRRNRIISGLSLGVLVVEASERSGSLITANFALEDNRELFAVPGQAGSTRSVGANNLIKQGAKLVEKIDDIIVEIESRLSYKNIHKTKREKSGMTSNLEKPLTDNEERIKSYLSYEPLYIDELTKKSDMDAGKVSSLLLSLEIKHVIKELPGKNFVLK
jgi:DNA processing protein